MPNFLDNLFQGDKKKDGGGPKNPFANMGGPKKFSGAGNSLGGAKAGKLIHVELKDPGTLGLKVEKRPNGQKTAIVSMVVAGSQADEAGLKRGDILCHAGSQGQSEIMYTEFLNMAKSPKRPLVFDIRRIETKAVATDSKSADEYARKQAVIAAAEAREKAHKQKNKPVPKAEKKLPVILSAEEKRQKELERQRDLQLQKQQVPKSEESRRAMEAAKRNEAQLANQLGYNPYETNKSTAGQARNATVTVQQGAIGSGGGGGASTTKKKSEPESIPTVRPPAEIQSEEDVKKQSTADATKLAESPFYEAYTIVITSNANNDAVVKTFGIMRTLVKNATTKGQNADESAAKFRRVRLTNAKIKAAIVDVVGALELMMLYGFQLAEEGGESHLVFPLGSTGPDWIQAAMRQLERYEKESTSDAVEC